MSENIIEDFFKDFVTERDEALLSVDETKIRNYMKKYEITPPTNMYVFWLSVHKSICAITGYDEQRCSECNGARSRHWQGV